jgi:hypothetical protein
MTDRPSGGVAGVWARFVLVLAILAAGVSLAWFLQAEGSGR